LSSNCEIEEQSQKKDSAIPAILITIGLILLLLYAILKSAIFRKGLRPYKIVMSAYNYGGRLPEFYESWMRDYADRILMIDDSSPDNTVEVARSLGLEIWEKAVNLRKPATLRHAIRHLEQSIDTIVLMDPDTKIIDRESFERALYQFQQSGADASSVQLMPSNTDNLVSRCTPNGGAEKLDHSKSFHSNGPKNKNFELILKSVIFHLCTQFSPNNNGGKSNAEDFSVTKF